MPVLADVNGVSIEMNYGDPPPAGGDSLIVCEMGIPNWYAIDRNRRCALFVGDGQDQDAL
jgi:hypothetical protein